MRLVSRIHKFFTNEVLEELWKVCRDDMRFQNNNEKVRKMRQIMDEYRVPYEILGPGTNRLAVLIDGYVFKLAMDTWGIRDNSNEYAMSRELQPFVIKVYESNDLITVSEYVTLLSREEFTQKKESILDILAILSESYLLGDVGYHPKNFANWGYRNDGQLVILDFAYIYNIVGEELLCSEDRAFLSYDQNFHDLKCPKCGRKYSFIDIRRKIDMEIEVRNEEYVKGESYVMTTDEEFFEEEKSESKSLDEEYVDIVDSYDFKDLLRDDISQMKKEENEMSRNNDEPISFNSLISQMRNDHINAEKLIPVEKKTDVEDPIDNSPETRSFASFIHGIVGDINSKEEINEPEDIEEEEIDEDEEYEEERGEGETLFDQLLPFHVKEEMDELQEEENPGDEDLDEETDEDKDEVNEEEYNSNDVTESTIEPVQEKQVQLNVEVDATVNVIVEPVNEGHSETVATTVVEAPKAPAPVTVKPAITVSEPTINTTVQTKPDRKPGIKISEPDRDSAEQLRAFLEQDEEQQKYENMAQQHGYDID